MTDGLDTLPGTLAWVWSALERGVTDRTAAARHPVMATIGGDGAAKARILVLRGADPAHAVLSLYTDGATAKVAEIDANPHGTVLVWDAEAQVQVRIGVQLAHRPGTPEEWDALHAGAQRVYGGTPTPGTPIDTPTRHSPAANPARFTVLTATVHSIETVYLGQDVHRRAVFRRNDGFTGSWVAP